MSRERSFRQKYVKKKDHMYVRSILQTRFVEQCIVYYETMFHAHILVLLVIELPEYSIYSLSS